MLNFCGIVATILKMATGRNFSMSGINSGHHFCVRGDQCHDHIKDIPEKSRLMSLQGPLLHSPE